MAYTERPWSRQPTAVGLKPNLATPYGRACTFLLDFGLADCVQGVAPIITKVVKKAAGANLGSIASARAVGNGITYGGRSRLTKDDYTIIFGVDLVTNTNGDTCGCLLALQDGGTSTKQLTITFDGNLATGSGGAGSLCCYEYQNGVTRVGAYADSQVGTGPAIYAVTRSGTSVKIYRNGVDVTTGQTAVGTGIPKGALSLYLHKQGEFVYNNLTSPLYFCAILDGVALTQSQVSEVSANPWSLFAPRKDFVGFPTTASSGTTIAVPAGALSLTGQVPTVIATANQTIAVPAGALSLTGQAPTVLTPQTIAVPAGALSLTGLAPTVFADASQYIQVPAGTLTLNGQVPTVVATANQTIAVPAGALALNGQIPTVVATDNKTVAVPAGALSLTGLVPSVLTGANQTIAVPTGSLSLSLFAPSVIVVNSSGTNCTEINLSSSGAGSCAFTGRAMPNNSENLSTAGTGYAS